MGKMIDYSNFDYQGFQITDYTSIDLTEIAEYLASLPKEWIMTVKLNEGAKIETVCKSLYGSTNYIDIILFLNQREQIFDMPMVFDVIEEQTSRTVELYFMNFNSDLSFIDTNEFKNLKEQVLNDLSNQNLKNRYLTVISPTKIAIVQSKINEIIQTQKEMYSILDLEND